MSRAATAQLNMQLLPEPRPAGKYEARPCPVCGETWIPWAFSILPCHARCVMAPAAREELVREFRRDERAPIRVLAERFGVTSQIVKATLHHEGIRQR